MTDSAQRNLRLIAEGYTEHNRTANRRWATCAVLSFLSLSFDPSAPTATVFSTELPSARFLVVVAVAIAMTNVTYIVAHMSALKSARVFHEVLSEMKLADAKVSKSFSEADIWNLLIHNNYNRLNPVFDWIQNDRLRKLISNMFKFVGDLLQILIPAAGMINAVLFVSISNAIIYQALVILVAVSIMSSVVFWIRLNYYLVTR